jgi:hypothetical protein
MADARIDAPAGAVCFGSVTQGALYEQCFDNPTLVPTNPYTPPTTFNTGDGTNCSLVVNQGSGNPQLCVHWAGSIMISQSTRVIGPRAAVFLASDSIMITGSVDASSTDTELGAAANTGSCNGATVGTDDTGAPPASGGGGGGGGGFGTNGGSGGTGSAAGGSRGTQVALTAIRGGCPGKAGGASNSSAGAAGGSGGGVIYFVAKNAIMVNNNVRANGARGRGAGIKAGGGGAGSGGLIVFDSATLTVTSSVVANGGGGGEGGDNDETGNSGQTSTSWNFPAFGGGNGADNGGDGGAGYARFNGAGGGAGGNSGGGGGGGGGMVKVYPPKSVSGNISPPPSS